MSPSPDTVLDPEMQKLFAPVERVDNELGTVTVTPEDIYLILTDIQAKTNETVVILRDLSAKIEAGVATIPEVVDKLGSVPIIGGAIRTLFNQGG